MSKKEKQLKSKSQIWAEQCANSGESMLLVPLAMEDKSDEMLSKTEAYMKMAREFDKATAEFDNFAKNFWYEMRKALEEEGVDGIFSKNIGWNTAAQKDGQKVINIVNAQQSAPPIRM